MSSHVVVRDWHPHLSMDEIDFLQSPFWIRISGLPPNLMTKSNAEKIGSKIGKVLEVDFTADGKIAWLRFLRIQGKRKKKGGRPFSCSYSGGLNGLISKNHLIDLGFSGNPFTWSNNRPLLANIKERVDKAYASPCWSLLFPEASVIHLPGKASDHLPLVLQTHRLITSGPKPLSLKQPGPETPLHTMW
ncbi:hypothetical protein RJ639_044000 [Escallonia herrerae]|uniref:DUF4283 domain-containing protein n=1 Tax=Escallonia herrerae TaxID=1293975 RepID=A0AA88WD42_9ASTE|nr:hypothetical protein RJ639_044000 [Escallonia herrerae]